MWRQREVDLQGYGVYALHQHAHAATQPEAPPRALVVADLKDAEKSRDETGLSPEGFAVYYLLKKERAAQAEKVAEQASEAFRRYPHWQTSERQEQDVRRLLYKALIDGGVEAVTDLAEKLMKLLRRSSK